MGLLENIVESLMPIGRESPEMGVEGENSIWDGTDVEVEWEEENIVPNLNLEITYPISQYPYQDLSWYFRGPTEQNVEQRLKIDEEAPTIEYRENGVAQEEQQEAQQYIPNVSPQLNDLLLILRDRANEEYPGQPVLFFGRDWREWEDGRIEFERGEERLLDSVAEGYLVRGNYREYVDQNYIDHYRIVEAIRDFERGGSGHLMPYEETGISVVQEDLSLTYIGRGEYADACGNISYDAASDPQYLGGY